MEKQKQKNSIELLAKKLGMTQVFGENRESIPVTVIELEPNVVAQIKTAQKEGYDAIQVAFGKTTDKHITAPLKGHLKNAGTSERRRFSEFKTSAVGEFELGKELGADQFQVGEYVDIMGDTKGRGFQGVMKRWRFKCGRATHGSMSHRRGGSYGQRQDPGEINRGKKMPGRMGGNSITVQNLVIVKVIPEKNVILVKGSIPGFNGSVIKIRRAKKK